MRYELVLKDRNVDTLICGGHGLTLKKINFQKLKNYIVLKPTSCIYYYISV